MKKLMILGASYSQVPLIRAAKELGLYTIAASIPGDYPGFAEADEACYVDISQPEAVLEAARSLGIDGITTCCMDTGLAAQGYVCSALGLPGPSRQTTELCTNKYLMKKAFRRAGIRTAEGRQICRREDLAAAMEELRFPLILKAVDQMGSRGIFRCDTPEEVYANYPRTMAATRQDYCLLEEFLVGEMFGVEAMISRGEPAYILPIGNDVRQGNPPFPIGHHVPWRHLDQLQEQVREQVLLAVSCLGCDNCPMDFDAMLKDGQVYLIEATARAGATGIAEMVSIHFNINYYQAIAAVAAGMEVAPYFSGSCRRPNLTHLLSSSAAGIVRGICQEGTEHPMISDLSFNIKPGDEVRPMTNGRDRIGQIILQGDRLEDCQKLLAETLAKLSLELEEADHAGIHRYPVL